jgi:hypothetical protein
MKKQAENWIFLADKDLYAAEIILKDEYPLTLHFFLPNRLTKN